MNLRSRTGVAAVTGAAVLLTGVGVLTAVHLTHQDTTAEPAPIVTTSAVPTATSTPARTPTPTSTGTPTPSPVLTPVIAPSATHRLTATPTRTAPRRTTTARPTTRHRTVTVRATAPGTDISYRTSQQVMVADRTSGTHGTWARYQWKGTSRGWVKESPSGVGSVFGSGGVVPASIRRQNTSTTPAGDFGFVSAFGVGNPGTKLAYRTVDSCSWWDENPASSTYNRFVENCRTTLKDPATGEHLASYTSSMYRQAAVLDYNYYGSQHRSGAGSGAGIFLHYATSHTGGCVALDSHSELNATIAWLDPAENPRIVIQG
jgi:L,D-peptidoglycan transpeptidase YkuD (ErfK/YbiS/YcfS/YnhG family)